MVKRITFPGMAIGIGDDRNWNLEDSVLDNMDPAVRLTPELRDEIRTALRTHLTSANLEMNAPKAKPILDRVTKIQKSVDLLIQAMAPLNRRARIENDDNKFDTLWLTFLREGYLEEDLQTLEVSLQFLKLHSEKVDRSLRRNVSGGPGRAKHPHLEPLIHHLAIIYEKAGGTVSAAYNDLEEHRETPFVIFVFKLLERLPPLFHIAVSALGEVTKRALRGWAANRSNLQRRG